MSNFFLCGIVFFGSVCFSQEKTIEGSPAKSAIFEKAMVIVSTSRNNKDYYERNLQSTLNQRYTNYRIIWVDDASVDGTPGLVEAYLKEHDDQKRVTLIKNKERFGSMKNFYTVISSCEDHEIVVIVDGDDWLAHENVLSVINKIYQSGDVWLTYGNYKTTHGQCGHYSQAIPNSIIENNSFRTYSFVSSHLRTHYAWLFKKISIDDLKYKDEFIPVWTDVGMMLPMLEMAGKHGRFIDEILYIYNTETSFNEFKTQATLGEQCVAHVRSLKKYEPLEKAQEITI